MDEPRDTPAGRNESIDELDALLDDPARWAEVDPEKLRHLLFYRCLSYGLHPDEESVPGLMALQRVAVERLHPAVRRQLVVHLARAIERVHREHRLEEGAGCTNALLPFLLEEPDPSVVATAATEMALLLPLEHDDPLTGPRYVRSLVPQIGGEEAKAGIIAGLLQLGDPRVAPLVMNGWREVGDEGRQTLALLIQAFRGVQALTVEFLVSWLEDEVRDPHASAFGVVAATLARAGGHAAEHGVTEVSRTFPVTDAPEREPLQVARQQGLEQFVPAIEERLMRAARAEQPPQLMPHVLSYWGLDDGAYRMAAAAGAQAAAATAETESGLCEPMRIDLVPDWPEEPERETLIEWGIFNPMGPSINTIRLTPLDGCAALVYTLYHPTGSASRVMALLPASPDASLVCAATVRVMARNGSGGVWLLRSLPDYVYLPAGSLVTPAHAAEGIAGARRAALRGGEERMDLASHIVRLRRLAANPWETTRSEMERAARAESREPRAESRDLIDSPGDYLAWLQVAASPMHVAGVRSQLPIAWQQAESDERGDAG